jgi:hypothetical protein
MWWWWCAGRKVRQRQELQVLLVHIYQHLHRGQLMTSTIAMFCPEAFRTNNDVAIGLHESSPQSFIISNVLPLKKDLEYTALFVRSPK